MSTPVQNEIIETEEESQARIYKVETFVDDLQPTRSSQI